MPLTASSTAEVAEVIAVAAKKVITFNFYEGGGVLTTGLKEQVAWFPTDTAGPTNWTVNKVVLMSMIDGDGTGSVTVDIIVEDTIGSNGPPVVADSIVGAGTKPSITTAKYSENTPSSWTTTTIARGSAMMIEIESISTFTGLMVAIELTANEP